jgi:hypothetical protein
MLPPQEPRRPEAANSAADYRDTRHSPHRTDVPAAHRDCGYPSPS